MRWHQDQKSQSQQQEEKKPEVQSKFAAQPQEEHMAILKAHFHKWWPEHLLCPFVYRADGEVAAIKSQIAFDAIVSALGRWADYHGNTEMTHGRLAELILRLDQEGRLPRKPVAQVIETVVEKPTPLTPKERLKHDADLTRKMNSTDSPIQGYSEHTSKPRATRAEIEAEAAASMDEQAAASNIHHAIRAVRGKSAGDTEARQVILKRLFESGIASGKSYVKIANEVMQKAEQMDTWTSPQQSIREAYAGVAAGKGIDLTTRTPSKYGESS